MLAEVKVHVRSACELARCRQSLIDKDMCVIDESISRIA